MIKLNLDVDKIPHFCQKLNELNCEFDIHNGRFVIDGKSLMGLYALNYNYDVYLQIINDNNNEKQILNILEDYIEKSSG